MTERELIEQCKLGNRLAQRTFYERFAPLMFSVCKRYLNRREEAEEALGNGLFKALTSIDSYVGAGSFEGWVRRIVVNEALMMLRRSQVLVFPGEEIFLQKATESVDNFSIESEISAHEILSFLELLPPGCRAVFNLYVIEGFKHQEIADTLKISVNTSKSQLILAKDKLKLILLNKGFV